MISVDQSQIDLGELADCERCSGDSAGQGRGAALGLLVQKSIPNLIFVFAMA